MMNFTIGFLQLLTVLSAVLLSANCETRFIILTTKLSSAISTSTSRKTGHIECQAISLKELKHTWTHNGSSFWNALRSHTHGSNLFIRDLNQTFNSNNYKCIVTCNVYPQAHHATNDDLDVTWISSTSVHRKTSLQSSNVVTMTCHNKHSKNAQIQWFKDFVQLQSNERITVNGQHVIIHNSTSSDNGLYSCRFRQINKNNKLIERNFNLNIDVDQSIHGGDLLDKIVKTPSGCCKNGVIEMYKDKLAPNGLYLCRKKRSDRTQNFNADNVAPENISKQSETTVTIDENESFTLGCDLGKGNKKVPSVIKWKKDGKPFRQIDINSPALSGIDTVHMDGSPQREDTRISINRRNGSLTFLSVISSDHGTYECNTFHENDIPISSRKTNLTVIERLKFVPQPTSKNLEMGTLGKVHCKVQGSPMPQVTWTKENSESPLINLADENGTLVFKNVTTDDKGNYTCSATNSQGTIKATVVIGAVVAPKFLVAPKGPIQAYEMSSVMIHCQATGDPMPTIKWDKDLQFDFNNDTADPSHFHLLDNGTLHIIEVHLDDEGAYGCTIGSSAGFKREEIRLTVRAADEFTAEENADGFMITRAVLITMSVAFAYIILVIGLMLWCRYRRQARKARLNAVEKDTVENGNGEIKMAEIEPCLPGNQKKKANGKTNHSKSDGAQKSDDTANSINSKTSKKSSNFDQITVPRSSLIDLIQIGQGDFGDVFIGKIRSSELKSIEDNAKSATTNEKHRSKTSLNEINEIKEEPEQETEFKEVLVKALNKVKDENICVEFRRQIEMFRAISHRGVTKLYGLCRDKDPHYLILEYTDWGDLKQFLISSRDVNDTSTKKLTNRQVLSLAHQIARAMDAVYRSRYIHKDLAARNCVITSNLVAKVTYPSLNRDTYCKEYFKNKNVLIPLRWMAPECLCDDDYSTKSDVYAYGVLVWELYTRAASLPLEELSNDEFLSLAKDNKLERKVADQTPTELISILTSCWNVNPKERPSFSQLSTVLGKSLQSESA